MAFAPPPRRRAERAPNALPCPSEAPQGHFRRAEQQRQRQYMAGSEKCGALAPVARWSQLEAHVEDPGDGSHSSQPRWTPDLLRLLLQK